MHTGLCINAVARCQALQSTHVAWAVVGSPMLLQEANKACANLPIALRVVPNGDVGLDVGNTGLEGNVEIEAGPRCSVRLFWQLFSGGVISVEAEGQLPQSWNWSLAASRPVRRPPRVMTLRTKLNDVQGDRTYTLSRDLDG